MKMQVRYIKDGKLGIWAKFVPSYFYGCMDFVKEVGEVDVLSEEWV